jgi:hypothetical protein
LVLIVVASVVAILRVRSHRASRRGERRRPDGLRPLLRGPTLAAASAPGLDGLGSAHVRMSRHEERPAPGLWPRGRISSTDGRTPPDEHREWTAEVAWDEADGMGRFRVVATSRDDRTAVTIAESEPLEWPPRGPAGVQAMSRAAEALEASLFAAGWKPRPPGDAWYAKRFAWLSRNAVEAVESEPMTVLPGRRRRFERDAPWPKGSADLWRCELEWRPGVVNSRFQAVVFEPGAERGRRIGESAKFKWLLMGDPAATAPDYRPELDRLTCSLEAAGWERVPIGARWFSRRFVWRRDSAPPDRIGAGPAEAEQSSG